MKQYYKKACTGRYQTSTCIKVFPPDYPRDDADIQICRLPGPMHIFLCGELNTRMISARFFVIFFDQDVDFFSIFILMKLSFCIIQDFYGGLHYFTMAV